MADMDLYSSQMPYCWFLHSAHISFFMKNIPEWLLWLHDKIMYKIDPDETAQAWTDLDLHWSIFAFMAYMTIKLK